MGFIIFPEYRMANVYIPPVTQITLSFFVPCNETNLPDSGSEEYSCWKA